MLVATFYAIDKFLDGSGLIGGGLISRFDLKGVHGALRRGQTRKIRRVGQSKGGIATRRIVVSECLKRRYTVLLPVPRIKIS